LTNFILMKLINLRMVRLAYTINNNKISLITINSHSVTYHYW